LAKKILKRREDEMAMKQRADGIAWVREIILLGDLFSKSNSRMIVSKNYMGFNKKTKQVEQKKMPMSIKSQSARDWMDKAVIKLATLPDRTIYCECGVDVEIYFSNNRHDADAELFFDALQKAGVIRNDRLIIYKKITKHIDRDCPRVVSRVFMMPYGHQTIIPEFKQVTIQTKAGDVL
jgi:hypothetical protein